jgi:hypothetical protein
MFMDTWVATDGITTVRFADAQSAEIYCAQTGWNRSDLFCIRQQVQISEAGSVTVEPWCGRMDPNVDCEVQGIWLDHVFVPPAVSMSDGSLSEDDVPVTYSVEYLRQLGSISERLRWDFRDLAATEPEIYSNLVAYVKKCDAKGKKPTLKEAEKIVGRYAS